MTDVHERYPEGIPFINNLNSYIDQEVFLVGQVINFKNNSLYMKLDGEGNEIHVENFNGSVPSSNFIALIARVLSNDTVEFVEGFSEGMNDFDLFDKISQYMKILGKRKDDLEKFV